MAEGLKRDDPYGVHTFMNTFVSPTLRQLAHDIPVPPGYKHNELAFALERDPEYIKGDSFHADLAEYAQKHEGQLRFWSLVGRLDADGLLGSDAPGVGAMPLLLHQGPRLLCALEDPVNRGVWETLWAAVLRCDEKMAYGRWGSHNLERLAEFEDAARKIAGDARVSLLWRGRFAINRQEPGKAKRVSYSDVFCNTRAPEYRVDSRGTSVAWSGAYWDRISGRFSATLSVIWDLVQSTKDGDKLETETMRGTQLVRDLQETTSYLHLEIPFRLQKHPEDMANSHWRIASASMKMVAVNLQGCKSHPSRIGERNGQYEVWISCRFLLDVGEPFTRIMLTNGDEKESREPALSTSSAASDFCVAILPSETPSFRKTSVCRPEIDRSPRENFELHTLRGWGHGKAWQNPSCPGIGETTLFSFIHPREWNDERRTSKVWNEPKGNPSDGFDGCRKLAGLKIPPDIIELGAPWIVITRY
ncbi:hypothetical protein DFH09DRAFT_1101009 [Mycena vulgaris]|nr:hypothetical protein DFH09DRAFT_1101009 [Mycena vulgaris]